MGRNRAISIGINKYEFSQPLKYAKLDAELMRDFLVKEAGFEQVLLFSEDSPNISGESTRASFSNLRRVLRMKFEKPFMQAGDNFWFFFSGHGMRHNGCDYLMASDSDWGDIEHTAISINYLTQRLRRCGADNVVLILDACRSQGSKSGEGVGNQAAQVAREKGVITIFSCSPNELSYEIDALQQGIFTKALLEGLGAQGKCATVERLNHYLSTRVSDLIRQYKKGDTSRQTPYMIAEPASKYHLILCPQYATKADVAPMKFDASIAELHQDFDLAEQLWIRVLAASPGGDMDAIKGLQRIAVAKIQPAAIPYQPSCKNSAATEKSPQPAPPNPTHIEPDVPLKSERAVDYTKLRDLLATEKWQEADEETVNRMLEVKERTGKFCLSYEDIDRFPCQDLRTIDILWVKYSNGLFGFSVQKRIYENLGGTRENDKKIWEAFGDRVGWRVQNNWLLYEDLKFDTKTPGRLPRGRIGWLNGRRGSLFYRIDICNLAVDYNETSSSPVYPPPPPTNVLLPLPISADVPLKSERGVDYTNLRDLLATGQWKNADKETTNMILKAARRTGESCLRIEDIDRFPCEDLCTIDQLWVKYSNGRFGFSVQKRIYQSLGRTREDDRKNWEAFGDRVGWHVNSDWLGYNDLKFNTKAPEGHLPTEGRRLRFMGVGFSALGSRFVKCNI
jgi:uncharacterized caspase-like protein